jgi:hypothetical protein
LVSQSVTKYHMGEGKGWQNVMHVTSLVKVIKSPGHITQEGGGEMTQHDTTRHKMHIGGCGREVSSIF